MTLVNASVQGTIRRDAIADAPEAPATALTAALVRARLSIASGKVHKGSKNSHQGYAYAGHEDVVEVARKALLAEGLTLTQIGVSYVGEVPKALLWSGDFVLRHTSGGSERMQYQATTMGSDKAAFIASTALDRTALLRVLQLAGSAEENPEHDSHEPQAQQQPRNTQQSAQRAQELLAGAAAKQADSKRWMDGHIVKLGSVQDPDKLVAWYRELMDYQGCDWNAKLPVRDAFGQFCRDNGCDPALVAKQARSK